MSITPRRLNFEPCPSQKYWLGGSPVKTYLVNALSVFIPFIEKFFIASVRAFYDEIQNDTLKEQVKLFIQQEANHSREYAKYVNAHILAYYPQLGSFRFPVMGFFIKISNKKLRLAMTAAGEHFTTVLSKRQLRQPELLEAAPSQIKELWHWHCIEEIEHKAVAFDVLKAIKISYFTRSVGFIMMSLFTSYAFLRLYWHMMKADGFHRKLEFYKESLCFFFTEPGYFRKMRNAYWHYLKPSFHPSQ